MKVKWCCNFRLQSIGFTKNRNYESVLNVNFRVYLSLITGAELGVLLRGETNAG